ncbi:MAG: trigger factor [Candidatus Bipolaricaulota bacterium]|nr:trigger factor [Candidatus Bipolaricaulota bacterium]
MKATKESKSPTQVVVRVEIPAATVRRKIDELFRHASREIHLPGFRPGHVPRAVLEARFGKDFLNEDAQAALIEEYLPQAFQQLQLRPISPPQTKPGEFDPQKDFIFEAEIEVLPDVTVKEYTGIEVQDIPVQPVPDSDIDAVLERLRVDHATLIPKAGEKSALVEAGDIVEVKIAGEDQIREWQATPGELTEKLIGHTVGQTLSLTVGEQRLELRIESVKVLEKPDLDELAKTLNHESIAALRKKIREELEESRAHRRERELKLKILDTIVAQTAIELPARFVEHLVTQELEHRQEQGLPEPSAEDVKKLKESVERRVKRELVLEAIKKQEHLALSDADFEKLLEEEAQKRQMKPIKLRALLEREGRLQSFRSELEDERVLQFLYERAKIT